MNETRICMSWRKTAFVVNRRIAHTLIGRELRMVLEQEVALKSRATLVAAVSLRMAPKPLLGRSRTTPPRSKDGGGEGSPPCLIRVTLACMPQRPHVWRRFGRPMLQDAPDSDCRCVYFAPGAMFGRIVRETSATERADAQFTVLRAVGPGEYVLRLKWRGIGHAFAVARHDAGQGAAGDKPDRCHRGPAHRAAARWRRRLVRCAPTPGGQQGGAAELGCRACRGAAVSGAAAMTPTRRKCLLGAAIVAVALVAAAGLPWPTRLLYNPSDSAPRGWYAQRLAGHLRPGGLVFARLPHAAAQFADRRDYLPQHLPILKRIGALGGQHVCLHGGLVRIDGRAVALALNHDGANRPLTPWRGCRVLGPDEIFLLSADHAASFDSRYFGPVGRTAVLGEAVPLWTW